MSDAFPSDPRIRASILYERRVDDVIGYLLRRYRNVDPLAVADAAVDGVMQVSRLHEEPPSAFWAIVRVAKDRLRSILRSETRRRRREKTATDLVTRQKPAAPSALDEAISRESEAEVRAAAAPFRDELARTDLERTAFDAWMDGTSHPADLAAVLGWDSDAGRTEAKKLLARFRQRLKRLKDRLVEEPR